MLQVQSPWNSLEVAKLVIQVLTPLVLLLMGIWVNRLARRIEAVQWANQKVVERRIAMHDELAPLLNDLYCYYRWVGNWKELSPKDVIERKRRLDKKVHVYESLFSPRFKSFYETFIDLCFPTYAQPGTDAKLLTSIKSMDGNRKLAAPFPWDNSWDGYFAYETENYDQRKEIEEAYRNFMSQFSRELGLGLGATPPVAK